MPARENPGCCTLLFTKKRVGVVIVKRPKLEIAMEADVRSMEKPNPKEILFEVSPIPVIVKLRVEKPVPQASHSHYYCR